MPIENTKMCAARSEDYNIPPNIICLPDTSYARDLQAQGACALRFLEKHLLILFYILRKKSVPFQLLYHIASRHMLSETILGSVWHAAQDKYVCLNLFFQIC